MIIKSGTVLVLQKGEYSDKTFEGPFTILKDIDTKSLVDLFTKQLKPDEKAGPTLFIAWLSTEGYIEDTKSGVLWDLGSEWDGFEPDFMEEEE